MANKYMKTAPHHMSSRKCKLKQHLDTTIHILEQPKSGTLTASNVGELGENQEHTCIAGGNAN